MSIDNCQVCDKRLDTDFVEYQEDGTLLCDSCLDEVENEQEPDWKALAGELAEALQAAVDLIDTPVIRVRPTDAPSLMAALERWNAALAKYDCSMKEQQEKGV
jgi:hypothetical protein